MSAVGGSNLTSVISQIIESAFESTQISSAGGDSPKINKVISVDINVQDFNSILENEIKRIVQSVTSGGGGGGGEGASNESESGTNVGAILGITASAVRNPAGAITSLATKLLPILGPAMAPLLIIPITEAVIDKITAPGMPVDPRFKRIIANEILAGMTRQSQEESRTGRRNVIIQSRPGFMHLGVGGNNSIMRQISEGAGASPRISNIGLLEHSQGLR